MARKLGGEEPPMRREGNCCSTERLPMILTKLAQNQLFYDKFLYCVEKDPVGATGFVNAIELARPSVLPPYLSNSTCKSIRRLDSWRHSRPLCGSRLITLRQ